MSETALQASLAFDELPVTDLGTISIRVFVLPPKPKKGTEKVAELPLDVQEGEEFMLDDKGATPVSSYLESSRGKRCVVYLVNGQRQVAGEEPRRHVGPGPGLVGAGQHVPVAVLDHGVPAPQRLAR